MCLWYTLNTHVSETGYNFYHGTTKNNKNKTFSLESFMFKVSKVDTKKFHDKIWNRESRQMWVHTRFHWNYDTYFREQLISSRKWLCLKLKTYPCYNLSKLLIFCSLLFLRVGYICGIVISVKSVQSNYKIWYHWNGLICCHTRVVYVQKCDRYKILVFWLLEFWTEQNGGLGLGSLKYFILYSKCI